MRQHKNRERGFSLVEFTLAGIPLILLLTSIIGMSLTMWNYHTLEFAVCEGARYATRHGQSCTYTGNSCSVSVANVISRVTAAGLGLSPSRLTVTLKSAAGTISCNPVNTCTSNSTVWPPSGANAVGSPLTVSATYATQGPLMFLFMPGSRALKINSLTLPASSTQLVLF